MKNMLLSFYEINLHNTLNELLHGMGVLRRGKRTLWYGGIGLAERHTLSKW